MQGGGLKVAELHVSGELLQALLNDPKHIPERRERGRQNVEVVGEEIGRGRREGGTKGVDLHE